MAFNGLQAETNTVPCKLESITQQVETWICEKRPEISLKYVCFLQFTDEEQTYFLHNVY